VVSKIKKALLGTPLLDIPFHCTADLLMDIRLFFMPYPFINSLPNFIVEKLITTLYLSPGLFYELKIDRLIQTVQQLVFSKVQNIQEKFKVELPSQGRSHGKDLSGFVGN